MGLARTEPQPKKRARFRGTPAKKKHLALPLAEHGLPIRSEERLERCDHAQFIEGVLSELALLEGLGRAFLRHTAAADLGAPLGDGYRAGAVPSPMRARVPARQPVGHEHAARAKRVASLFAAKG